MAGFDLNTPLGQALINTGQQMGYDPDHIAGALGTAMTESRFDPSNTSGDNGHSWGGFQWQGPRLQALQQYAASQGKSWQDPNLQAQFWYNEHNGPEAKAGFNDASGINGVANSVLRSQRPLNWQSDPAVGQKYLSNIVAARRALAASGGSDGSPMAYASTDDDGSGGAMGAINGAMMQGRSGSTGGMTPATPDDTSNLNNMLARARLDSLTKSTSVPETDDPVEKFGNGLTRFGAALMARDNPNGAYVLLNGIKAQTKVKDNEWKDGGLVGDGKYRRYYNAKGEEQFKPVDPQYQDTEKEKEATDRDMNSAAPKFQQNSTVADNSEEATDAINKIRQGIAEGKISLSGYDKAKGFTLNVLNSTDDNAAAYKEAEARMNKYVLQTVQQYEKGYTSNKQLAVAGAALAPNGAQFSNRTMLDVMDRMAEGYKIMHHNAVNGAGQYLNRMPKLADSNLLDPDTGEPQGPDYYHNKWNGAMKRFNDFQKDYGPKRDAFIQKWNEELKKKASPTGGASTSFTDRFKKQFGVGGGGGPTGAVSQAPAAPQDDNPYFDPR